MNDVADWLRTLGLEAHAPAFEAQGIDFALLPELGDADLKELGVTLLGHRKRLLLAIAALDRDVAPPAASQPTPSAPPAPARDAERRQLTVMFCDLVGSTQLAAQLDPEDLQRVLRSFHEAVAGAVAGFDGHVAQLLGDGALVYFGYPHAHENDAERAVHAALSVLKAVAALRPLAGPPLQTRIGIATGLVVVGEVGAGTAAAEHTASGETPNLAARLQGQAAPGEIVISDETRRLGGAAFDLTPTGALRLKGFAEPVAAWRVLGERSVASRFEAQHESELIDFVGRASEVSLLLERWSLACDGEGQVVLLSGEAGIGKSRIVQTLRERLAAERHATIVLQCSPYHRSSALYPLLQYFERTTGITPDDDAVQRGRKLARLNGPDFGMPAESFARFLRLMGAVGDDGAAPAAEEAPVDSRLTLQAPIELLRALAGHLPVLMLIEDAHWIDPTTEELIGMTIEQSRDTRLLTLVTCRPEYMPAWGTPAHLTRLALNRLGQRQCAELVSAVAGRRELPPKVLAEIIAKTDGIPLFVEELTKTVLQSGLLEDTAQGWRLRGPLPSLAIPATLQDSLMARLDRLAPAKEVAQVGAMIGRDFSRRLLEAVLAMPAERLNASLADLVASELVVRRGSAPNESYSFRHALIRDTAYASMLKGQRMLRHAQIAAAMERVEPDTRVARPELLAYHCQEGGQAADALRYWRAAGDLAAHRAAHREALMHYRAALAVLADSPADGERDGIELDLQIKLGNLLMQTEGFGSAATVAAHTRAQALALALGRSEQYVLVCGGVAASLWSAGRFDEVSALLSPLVMAGTERVSPMIRVTMLVLLGLAKLTLGELDEARRLTDDAVRVLGTVPLAERQDISGVDPRVVALTQSVSLSVHQGLLDRADAETREALAVAEERDHAPTRSWAMSLARWMAYRHGDMEASIRLSQELLALAERMDFKARFGSGRILMGRAVVATGRIDEGRALLQEGFRMWSALGAQAGATELTSIAADALVEADCMADAEFFVAAGEKVQASTGERHFAAELTRLRGRLCAAGGDAPAAEAGLREAMAIAEAQGARLFTLRAATDLARLLQSQGRGAEAAALLQAALEALPEGRTQRDGRRAQAALDALRAAGAA